MLMWWDGLAETENYMMEEAKQTKRENVTSRAVSVMVGEMARTQQPGEQDSSHERITPFASAVFDLLSSNGQLSVEKVILSTALVVELAHRICC